MTNNNIISTTDKASYQSIKYINKVNDFLFIKLNDNSCFLTDGSKIIKLNNTFRRLDSVITYNDTYYALSNAQIINLNTGEVLLTDSSIVNIYKEDDDTIYIIRYGKPNTLFSLKTKNYLPVPDNYEFECNLGNNLYSFCEKNYDKEAQDLNHLIINSQGLIIKDNIKGYLQSFENNIIITRKDNKIIILKIKNNNEYELKEITKTDSMLKAPEYYQGQIIIIEKGIINIWNLDLENIQKITIPNLDLVYDWEVTGGIIKLQLPDILNGKDVTKYLYINLTNGKEIKHRRIDAIPYFTPEFYVGFDNLKSYEYEDFKIEKPTTKNTYYFYDQAFNKKVEINGDDYEDLDNGKFIIHTYNQNSWRKNFINIKNNIIKDCPYDDYHFAVNSKFGYGFNQNTDMIDIFDHNLTILFKNIDYKKYGIKQQQKIAFRIVNNYLIFQVHYDNQEIRNIIFDNNTNVLFDSNNHTCKPLGNLIEIKEIDDDNSLYLNTLTGKLGTLYISQSDIIPKLVMDDDEKEKAIIKLTLKDEN